ncbi:cupin domain-containing protein [Phenylobacterium sp.]|jgi:uncharacterized cupin superfamily protein|uniref:cupin domain-containing protein n=1 Tax=Phenylobacterium sp. TaxID=1871053 RepID=UPI0037830995
MIRLAILAAALTATAGAAAAQTLHPLKISPAEARGPVFERKEATKGSLIDGTRDTHHFQMLRSQDRAATAGVFKSGPAHAEYETYGADEFMYFLEGSVTLTSADGTVTKAGPGDAVTIPKEWKGRWDTDGYTKYYVVYTPRK